MANIDISKFVGTGSSSGGIGNMLSDYNSIKNGSYKKLLKANYAADEAAKAASGTKAANNNVVDKILEEKKNPKISKEAQAANSALVSDVSSLKSSIGDLQKASTYEDGSDGIAAKAKVATGVKSFVEDYNKTVKDAKDSTLTGATGNVASMMKVTDQNADKLKEIGVSVREDGTLFLDEKKLESTDVNKVKELFDAEEVTSYGSAVASRVRYAGYSTGNTVSALAEKEKGNDDVSKKAETDTAAKALKDDIATLTRDDIFKKVVDDKGDVEYDLNAITAKAKSFINNYNELIDSAKNSLNSGVTSNLSYMMDRTRDNAGALERFGITVNNNGSLKLNEKVFAQSDMAELRSFFNDYGSGTATNASLIGFYMSTQADATNGYNDVAAYNIMNDPVYQSTM